MKLPFLLALMFIFVSSGCLKEFKLFNNDNAKFDGISCSGKCHILTGHIIDTPNRNGIEDLELKFYYKQRNAWFSQYLGSTRTKKDGSYIFKFDASEYMNKSGQFSVQQTNEMYMRYDPNDNAEVDYFHLDSNNVNQPFKQNFTLMRTAKLKVHITSGKDLNQSEFKFSYNYGWTTFIQWFKGPGPIDKTYTVFTGGGLNTRLEVVSSGTGDEVKRKIDITVPPGESRFVELSLD